MSEHSDHTHQEEVETSQSPSPDSDEFGDFSHSHADAAPSEAASADHTESSDQQDATDITENAENAENAETSNTDSIEQDTLPPPPLPSDEAPPLPSDAAPGDGDSSTSFSSFSFISSPFEAPTEDDASAHQEHTQTQDENTTDHTETSEPEQPKADEVLIAPPPPVAAAPAPVLVSPPSSPPVPPTTPPVVPASTSSAAPSSAAHTQPQVQHAQHHAANATQHAHPPHHPPAAAAPRVASEGGSSFWDLFSSSKPRASVLEWCPTAVVEPPCSLGHPSVWLSALDALAAQDAAVGFHPENLRLGYVDEIGDYYAAVDERRKDTKYSARARDGARELLASIHVAAPLSPPLNNKDNKWWLAPPDDGV